MFQVCDLIHLNFCLSLGQSHTHEGLVYNVKQFVLNYLIVTTKIYNAIGQKSAELYLRCTIYAALLNWHLIFNKTQQYSNGFDSSASVSC